jgi:AraC-like DNA-binding protein
VSRYIQRERLLEAQTFLSDPKNTQSISEIAGDLCFADAPGFGRTFKREFGHSPSELQSVALALHAEPRSRAPSSTANFGALLRLL